MPEVAGGFKGLYGVVATIVSPSGSMEIELGNSSVIPSLSRDPLTPTAPEVKQA
jgi:hypothetical protein